MAYGGESIAKKLARYTLWVDILEDPKFAPHWADLGRFLVLCGPDRGDITFLDTCLYGKSHQKEFITKYQPDELLIAVDQDVRALENGVYLDEHNLYAPAIYKHASVDEVAREYKKEFSCIYLDLCSNISESVLDTAARTIALGLRDRGAFAITVMTGREVGGIFEKITGQRPLFYGVEGPNKENHLTAELSEAAILRAEFLYRGLTKRLEAMCVGYVELRGILTYTSDRGGTGKRKKGVPMLSMWWRLNRPHKPMNHSQFKAWQRKEVPVAHKTMIRALGNQEECAKEIIDICLNSKKRGMPLRLIERTLNIKFEFGEGDDEKMRVYDWNKLIEEEESEDVFSVARKA